MKFRNGRQRTSPNFVWQSVDIVGPLESTERGDQNGITFVLCCHTGFWFGGHSTLLDSYYWPCSSKVKMCVYLKILVLRGVNIIVPFETAERGASNSIALDICCLAKFWSGGGQLILLTVRTQIGKVCISPYICIREGGYYYTVRISGARGVKRYNNIHLLKYKYLEIETPFHSETW